MSCDLTKSVLHGYLDGELDAARAADFERHLVSCSECVTALEAQERLRSSILHAGLYERAPSSLRKQVQAQLATPARPPATVVPISPAWRWLALAAIFLLVVFAGWRGLSLLRSDAAENTLVAALVDAHLRSLQPGHLEDVVSTDQHTVKPWFDGRIDFAPPVRDFAEQGFPLQGGRLDVVRGRSVAVMVYMRRKHIINVFVWPTSEHDSDPVSGSQLGYHWVDWRKAGMELCAVSDVSTTDLAELQQLLAQ